MHPDVVSYLSVVAAGLAALCFLLSAGRPWLLPVAPLFMYARLWMNMLDGMVAVEHGRGGLAVGLHGATSYPRPLGTSARLPPAVQWPPVAFP